MPSTPFHKNKNHNPITNSTRKNTFTYIHAYTYINTCDIPQNMSSGRLSHCRFHFSSLFSLVVSVFFINNFNINVRLLLVREFEQNNNRQSDGFLCNVCLCGHNALEFISLNLQSKTTTTTKIKRKEKKKIRKKNNP